MSDSFGFSGGEIRLGSGQLAEIDAGVVRILSPELPVNVPDHHFCMTVAHARDLATSVSTIRSATYDALIAFLKQLEPLDYLLINIERAAGSASETVGKGWPHKF
jgi:hypothetical protein